MNAARVGALSAFVILAVLWLGNAGQALEPLDRGVVAEPGGALRQPIPERLVVLTFDDAILSHYTFVAPLLKKHGFGATFFISEHPQPPFAEHKDKYMTWEQIQALDRMGFEVANHTRTHAHVNKIDRPRLVAELEYIERRCQELEIPKPTTFAYPGYDTHPAALKTLAEKGYLFARTGGARPYSPEKDHPLLIPSFSTTGTDEGRVLGALKQARDGRIVVLTIHGAPDLAHPWVNTPPELFERYLTFLDENDYTVIALRDLAKYVAPANAPNASAPPALSQGKAPPKPSFPDPLIERRADPWVWKHRDGHYYFTATVPAYDRIELRRSKTLTGLRAAEPKVVWRKHERGPMSWHIWAPELHFIDGKWYLYFAAGQAEAIWDIRMYALENPAANPLEGEWIEKGQIRTNWESFSLDATTFERRDRADHRGRRYLVWAQKAPEIRGNTNLYLAELENPWTIKGRQIMISKPEYGWERIGFWVNEGPAALVRNGRVFLAYSASATDHNYCLGLLTAAEDANLLNPKSWKKSPTPVFKSSPPNSQYGPGHSCFTVAEDGRTDLLIYHARGYKEIQGDPLKNPDRHTRVKVLNWKSDGAPDFGEPGANGPQP